MLLNVVEIEKYYRTRNNLKKALDQVSFSVNNFYQIILSEISAFGGE